MVLEVTTALGEHVLVASVLPWHALSSKWNRLLCSDSGDGRLIQAPMMMEDPWRTLLI
jgi:hypothetical protein